VDAGGTLGGPALDDHEGNSWPTAPITLAKARASVRQIPLYQRRDPAKSILMAGQHV
jgi:hypothetical protein